MPGPASGIPASGRPPEREGNFAAVKHGATSPRMVDPLAASLRDEVLATAEADGMPWIATAAFRPALESWARHEAKVILLERFLHAKAEEGNAGGLLIGEDVRPAADLLLKFEKAAANSRARLGLDPVAAARLGRDTAAARVDLARLWAHTNDDQGDEDD